MSIVLKLQKVRFTKVAKTFVFFFIFFQKTLDKRLTLCYNKDRKKERGNHHDIRRYLSKITH